MRPVRVLIVDDSAVTRSLLSRRLSAAGMEVAGVAADPYAARDLILLRRPDVLTLDLEMPRMDGLTFLDRLMTHFPLPVIVLSGLTEARGEMALQALEMGAIDVVDKPNRGLSRGLGDDFLGNLVERLEIAAQSKPRRRQGAGRVREESRKRPPLPGHFSEKLVAIGASTGGTSAVAEVLESLPSNHPGVLVVQHMPAFFTKNFAERLDKSCALRVREARTGDEIKDGTVLIAPGDRHMILRRTGDRYAVECTQGPPVHHVRPSVDVLFRSVAQAAGHRAVGVLLTGMGKDGAEGLSAMREAGAVTLAQDEDSCVVYGMPREAVALGAVQQSVPLGRMAEILQSEIQRMDFRAKAAQA